MSCLAFYDRKPNRNAVACALRVTHNTWSQINVCECTTVVAAAIRWRCTWFRRFGECTDSFILCFFFEFWHLVFSAANANVSDETAAIPFRQLCYYLSPLSSSSLLFFELFSSILFALARKRQPKITHNDRDVAVVAIQEQTEGKRRRKREREKNWKSIK